MKRTLSLILAMCMALSLGSLSCLAAEEGEGTAVELGQALPLDFAELVFDEVKLLAQLDSSYSTKSEDGSSSSSMSMTMAPPEGMKFFCLVGSIKNTDGAEYAVSNLVGEAVFDGEYTYPLSVKMAFGGAFPSKLAPLTEGTIYVYARIPDELAENFASFRFSFGMEDSFAESMPETAEECAHTFTYEAQWDGAGASAAAGTEEAAAAETLAIGDAIDLDFVQITVEDAGVKDSLQVSSNASGIKITSCPAPVTGKQYVYVQGKLKNLATSAVRPQIVGTVEIDGYSYELKSDLTHADATPTSKAEPLDEVTYTLYASVPSELTGSFQTCTVRFGFDDGFSNNVFAAYDDCAHRYQCDLAAGN